MHIGENRHRAIGLEARCFAEFDALLQHRRMVAGKVVGFQEQEDTATGLVADALPLRLVGRFCQKQPGALPVGRRHRDPALATAEIDIFGEQKTQPLDIPGNRLVVIGDDQGDRGDATMLGEPARP